MFLPVCCLYRGLSRMTRIFYLLFQDTFHRIMIFTTDILSWKSYNPVNPGSELVLLHKRIQNRKQGPHCWDISEGKTEL